MKDIEYEKDGARKFAQERFKDDLIAIGWKVVKEEEKKEVKPGRKPKKAEDDNS